MYILAVSPVRVVTKEWQFLGAGYVGIFPTPVVILVIVLIITAIIMNKTKWDVICMLSEEINRRPSFRN